MSLNTSALNRAIARVQEESSKLALTQRVLEQVLPEKLKLKPWNISQYKEGRINISFKVKTLSDLKKIIKHLKPQDAGRFGPIKLTVGPAYGYYFSQLRADNTWQWNWIRDNDETVYSISVQCEEIIGHSTAVKKIKYYYDFNYKLTAPEKVKPVAYACQECGKQERSEYAGSFVLYWDKLPFKGLK